MPALAGGGLNHCSCPSLFLNSHFVHKYVPSKAIIGADVVHQDVCAHLCHERWPQREENHSVSWLRRSLGVRAVFVAGCSCVMLPSCLCATHCRSQPGVILVFLPWFLRYLSEGFIIQETSIPQFGKQHYRWITVAFLLWFLRNLSEGFIIQETSIPQFRTHCCRWIMFWQNFRNGVAYCILAEWKYHNVCVPEGVIFIMHTGEMRMKIVSIFLIKNWRAELYSKQMIRLSRVHLNMRYQMVLIMVVNCLPSYCIINCQPCWTSTLVTVSQLAW